MRCRLASEMSSAAAEPWVTRSLQPWWPDAAAVARQLLALATVPERGCRHIRGATMRLEGGCRYIRAATMRLERECGHIRAATMRFRAGSTQGLGTPGFGHAGRTDQAYRQAGRRDWGGRNAARSDWAHRVSRT